MVVEVFVAQCNAQNSLHQHASHRVLDALLPPFVANAPCNFSDQPQTLLCLPQQKCTAAVTGDIATIKRNIDIAFLTSWKQSSIDVTIDHGGLLCRDWFLSIQERRPATFYSPLTTRNVMGRPFWAYMLRCVDDSFYVGHTDDIERRLNQHNDGNYCRYTRSRRPLHLIWSSEFSSREEAKEAERKLKGWSRAKKQALADGDYELLSLLASRSERARALRDGDLKSPPQGRGSR